jgi:hypothetical protein
MTTPNGSFEGDLTKSVDTLNMEKINECFKGFIEILDKSQNPQNLTMIVEKIRENLPRNFLADMRSSTKLQQLLNHPKLIKLTIYSHLYNVYNILNINVKHTKLEVLEAKES